MNMATPSIKPSKRSYGVLCADGFADRFFVKHLGEALQKVAVAPDSITHALDLMAAGSAMGQLPSGEGVKLAVEPVSGSAVANGPCNPVLGSQSPDGRLFLVVLRAGDIFRVNAADATNAFKAVKRKAADPQDVVLVMDLARWTFPPENFDHGRFTVRLVEPPRATFKAMAPDEPVRLRDCPAGPFLHGGRLGLKTTTGRSFDVTTGAPIKRATLRVQACVWRKGGDY